MDPSKGHPTLPTTAKGNVQRNRVEKIFAAELKEGEGRSCCSVFGALRPLASVERTVHAPDVDERRISCQVPVTLSLQRYSLTASALTL